MIEAVLEWVEKAESDFQSAELVIRPPKGKPNYDLVCFLSQQCVEKYLKGFLLFHEISFQKTHSLVVLLDLALVHQPLWESDTKKAHAALTIASEFRSEIRNALELPNG